MGSLKEKDKELSLEEKAKLLPMLNCCRFARRILISSIKIIDQNIEDDIEVQSELLTEEAVIDFKKSFLKKDINGYSYKDITYTSPPKIEGGDYYNFHVKTKSDVESFTFEVFKCSVGVKLADYHCYVARSLYFRNIKDSDEKNIYRSFEKLVYEEILNNLKDGVALSTIYQIAQSFAQKENPSLAKHLEKNFGFQLTSNYEDKSTVISLDSKAIAKTGTFFAVCINLVGLEEKGTKFNAYFCDTVCVRKDRSALVLTYLPE